MTMTILNFFDSTLRPQFWWYWTSETASRCVCRILSTENSTNVSAEHRRGMPSVSALHCRLLRLAARRYVFHARLHVETLAVYRVPDSTHETRSRFRSALEPLHRLQRHRRTKLVAGHADDRLDSKAVWLSCTKHHGHILLWHVHGFKKSNSVRSLLIHTLN